MPKMIHRMLVPSPTFIAEVPAWGKPVHAAMQGPDQSGELVPVVWIEADTTDVLVMREFCVCKTGTEIPDNYKHFASISVSNNATLHVYEVLGLAPGRN